MIPKIREVHIRNYKSIAQAVVPLSDLTLLVGPNGSGKTNFVDALAFVQECLSESIETAVRNRGNISSVHRQDAPDAEPFGIRVVLDLDADTAADYAFEITPGPRGRFEVTRERCVVVRGDGPTHSFLVERGVFQEGITGLRPRVEPNRLALYAASATTEFRSVYDFLVSIRPYQIVPGLVGDWQESASGEALNRDGSNSASVLRELRDEDPDRLDRISRLIGSVVAGVVSIEPFELTPLETVAFTEDRGVFLAAEMSEGTLRLLGLLLAAYQPSTPSVLIIEEPEVAIHPAAAEVVMSVLLDACKRTQVVVTTHSPDILDHKSVGDESIRVVTKEDGGTVIAPVAPSSRQAIRERLYSPGELLRSDELNPDLGAAEALSQRADLFGPPAQPMREVA